MMTFFAYFFYIITFFSVDSSRHLFLDGDSKSNVTIVNIYQGSQDENRKQENKNTNESKTIFSSDNAER